MGKNRQKATKYKYTDFGKHLWRLAETINFEKNG